MDIKKTLCKQCQECKTFIYENINRKKELTTFQYCKGNKKIVKSHKYTISDTNNRINIHISSGLKQNKLLTTLFKQNKKNDVKFLDKDRTNLKMNNLQERPRSCTLQGRKSIKSNFPGVRQNKQGKYEVLMKINKKLTYFGQYDKEVDAFHHYLLKCEKIGRTINKTTEAYKKYEKKFNIKEFELHTPRKYGNKNKHKYIYYRKDSDKYVVMFTKNGKTVFRKQCDSLKEAIRVKKEYLNNKKNNNIN